jgi:hypothetical protein
MAGLKYSHITSQTSTQIRTGKAKLYKVIINKATANGVITLADATSGSTPAVAIITTPGSVLQNHVSLDYGGIEFATGLRVVTATADQDITVVWE